jgi:hypothetical protein
MKQQTEHLDIEVILSFLLTYLVFGASFGCCLVCTRNSFFAELGQFRGQGLDQGHMRGSQRSHIRGGATPDLQVFHRTGRVVKFQGKCDETMVRGVP